ncbi:50S ribosomal protein L21 [Haliangium ochraceum]|uniref:Large ribosomal subunit protein bL21 n=1 Tax=Haliangium ochraceum (strain DSM 14365 / JCM 11303 / SMP-2) TaxID=502025 RepID=D0LHV2_HALO1|nr:ribosomal protein L21 [Haliangium ochraceum DSM 14365]
MYAVIQTGGKQYRVAPGDTLTVEKLPGNVGDAVEFDKVLLLSKDGSVSVGKPVIDGAKVTGKILEHDRGKKLVVFKFARRKDYRRRNGHRQDYTSVQIADVLAP